MTAEKMQSRQAAADAQRMAEAQEQVARSLHSAGSEAMDTARKLSALQKEYLAMKGRQAPVGEPDSQKL